MTILASYDDADVVWTWKRGALSKRSKKDIRDLLEKRKKRNAEPKKRKRQTLPDEIVRNEQQDDQNSKQKERVVVEMDLTDGSLALEVGKERVGKEKRKKKRKTHLKGAERKAKTVTSGVWHCFS